MKANLSKSNPPQVFYKYRSFEGINDFKRFVEIILKKQLHAAKYQELNDPMEGIYIQRDSKKTLRTRIKICSLSETEEDILMWSYYANGHRGVVLGVTIVPNKRNTIKRIEYDGEASVENWNQIRKTVEEILSHKVHCWQHEKEWRVFTFSDYIDVEIKEIILGSQMKPDDKTLVKEIVKKINPKINVIEQPCC
ncbi:MAG: DUF2971 domain-containing protein [Bacteroidales bacterium]